MAKYTETLDWKQINVETLPAQMRKAYDKYRAASKAAGEKKAAFDAQMATALAKQVPTGKRLVVGHSFGKLSVALASALEERKTNGNMSASFSGLSL